MGVAFISKVLELFGQIFMKFWNLPVADLGFNLGTFVVFILLIKFAMSVFLSIDIQPVSTRQGFSKISRGSKKLGKRVAGSIRKKNKKKED